MPTNPTKQNSIQRFLEDPEIKEFLKNKNLDDVVSYAISLGNVSRDEGLRKFGARLDKRIRLKRRESEQREQNDGK